MAIYNEILVGRYARMLQKLFGIKGGVPTKQLAGEIAPAFPIFSGAENRFLESWNRWAAGLSFPAVAGQTVGVRLRNPLGNNVIAVIEKIAVNSASPQEIDIGLGTSTTDFTIGTPTFLDGRQPVGGSSIVQSTSTATPAAPSPPIQRVTAINQNLEIITDENQEIVLSPGGIFQITSTTVNVAVLLNVWWRERFLEEPERQ